MGGVGSACGLRDFVQAVAVWADFYLAMTLCLIPGIVSSSSGSALYLYQFPV